MQYNYKLVLEYDGLNYFGWQKQKYTDRTIQEKLENSLGTILRSAVKVTGAGRTDSGVSAYNQCANFHFDRMLDVGSLRYSLNSLLPSEIAVKKISRVSNGFSARYSATKREYIYKIALDKKSVEGKYFYRCTGKIDFDEVNKFLKFIKLQKNFRPVCKNSSDKNNFRCDIFEFDFKLYRRKKELIFRISASRFLHSMVRALVGYAIEIGKGRLALDEVKMKFKKGEKLSVTYLPSYALFLNKIHY